MGRKGGERKGGEGRTLARNPGYVHEMRLAYGNDVRILYVRYFIH